VATLIVYVGDEDYYLPPATESSYLYVVGSGNITGREVFVLNDEKKLNQIAESIRDDYVEWVYSLNSEFIDNDIKWNGTSLFWFSDLSCKRTELFDTFNSLCSLLLIKEALKKEIVDSICLIGLDNNFVACLVSAFPKVDVVCHHSNSRSYSIIRSVVSDLRFGLEIAGIGLINAFTKGRKIPKKEHAARVFFSIFPKMITNEGIDKKYVGLVKKEDRFAISIVTDGMHQHVTLPNYLKYRRVLPKNRYVLIDSQMKISDVLVFFKWLIRLQRFLMVTRSATYKFNDIDLSAFIREEKFLSCRRISRLIIFGQLLQRLLRWWDVTDFVYYLHEYPIGRMISYVLGINFPNVRRIGFQHGPASWRKLLYFMAKNEGSANVSFKNKAPLPDFVLAEDMASLEIYRYAGYADVEIMESVHRLNYLDGIQPRRELNCALIAPGLHDGKAMLDVLEPVIRQNRSTTFLLRPHPLANRAYLKGRLGADNIQLAEGDLPSLLEKVGKVYVTYSSIGAEAKAIGIDAEVVNIPGRINESPLLDRKLNVSEQMWG